MKTQHHPRSISHRTNPNSSSTETSDATTSNPKTKAKTKSRGIGRIVRDLCILGLAAMGGQAASGTRLASKNLVPMPPIPVPPPGPKDHGAGFMYPIPEPARRGRNVLWAPVTWAEPSVEPNPQSLTDAARRLIPQNGMDSVYRLYGDDATQYFLSNDPNYCRHLRNHQRMQKHRFGVLFMGPRIEEIPGKEVDPGWPLHDMSITLYEHDTTCKLHNYARWYNRTVVYNYDGNLGDFLTLLTKDEAQRLEPWMWVGMKVHHCKGLLPEADDRADTYQTHDPRYNMHIYGPHDDRRCVPAPRDKVKPITAPLY